MWQTRSESLSFKICERPGFRDRLWGSLEFTCDSLQIEVGPVRMRVCSPGCVLSRLLGGSGLWASCAGEAPKGREAQGLVVGYILLHRVGTGSPDN